MSNRQETSVQILKEMRDGFNKSWHDIDREWAHGLADRLEEAHRRELFEAEASALEIAGYIEASRHKPTGNAAAMHEALEAARDLLLPQCNGGTAFARACGEVVNRIMDALSAPARNCDRFENWADALRVYLAEHPKMADMDQRAIDACCNMWLFNQARETKQMEVRND